MTVLWFEGNCTRSRNFVVGKGLKKEKKRGWLGVRFHADLTYEIQLSRIAKQTFSNKRNQYRHMLGF